MKIQAFTLAIVFILSACVATTPDPISEPSDYEKQIREWHQTRNEQLIRVDGWLTLSGLFWLEQGNNRFGGSGDNDLVFPGNNIPEFMGTLSLAGDSVSFTSAPGMEITLGDSLVNEMGLRRDLSGEPDILSWGSLTWYIIQRGEKTGVRLKDAKNPNYVNFKPTELFPIDSTWRVPATLVPFDTATTVDIINVLGDSEPSPTPGLLHFKLGSSEYTLTPLANPGDESYFIIFGDATNGLSTYGAGRFLVVPAVDESSTTFIDFNKAYNMPCVFSPYATCPLPPTENLLTIAIEAGETDYRIKGGH